VYLRFHGRIFPRAAPRPTLTDVIHPDNREMGGACRALPSAWTWAGVDFLSKDIKRKATAPSAGGICEVNRRARLSHACGAERRQGGATVAAPVVTMLFPAGAVSSRRTDCGDHRHQWQDHDGAHAPPHLTKMGGYTPGV